MTTSASTENGIRAQGFKSLGRALATNFKLTSLELAGVEDDIRMLVNILTL